MKILAKYFNNSNIFSVENVAKLLENTKINKHTIKLEKDKQPFFEPIYGLELVELRLFKT